MIAYALLLDRLGFIIATAIAVFVLSWRLGASRPAAVLTGIGVAVLIYVVFHLILGLSLATGAADLGLLSHGDAGLPRSMASRSR